MCERPRAPPRRPGAAENPLGRALRPPKPLHAHTLTTYTPPHDSNDPLLEIAMELEKIALADEYFVKRNLYPNVSVLHCLGIVWGGLGEGEGRH